MKGLPQRRLAVEILGVHFDVVVEDPHLSVALTALLADLTRPRTADADDLVRVTGKGPWHISSAAVVADATDVPSALSAVMTALNLTAIRRTRTLSFHCSVVARGASGLVVPAPSGCGKTTLTGALLQRGWAYLSDEALCLSWDDLTPRRYARPLALSPWSAQVLGIDGVPGTNEVFARPEDLGAELAGNDVRVGHIVLLDRDGSAPRLEPVHRAEAAAELLRRSFTHFQDPPVALAQVAKLVASATTQRLHLGDPREAADLLTERLT